MAPLPWTYVISKVRVIDGDTIEATLDLGFYIAAEIPIRLDGINAAEHGTPAGERAKTWLEGRCRRAIAAKQFTVTTRKEAKGDKYGRILGVLWGNGENLNELAVKRGHALPYSGSGVKPVPGSPGG